MTLSTPRHPGEGRGPDYPTVTITFRPPCATDRIEVFGLAPHGPEAEWVAKAVCRGLALGPAAFDIRPDPKARDRRDEQARCYVIGPDGQPVAHVVGLSFAWLAVAASRLANEGWMPGRNRLFGDAPAVAA